MAAEVHGPFYRPVTHITHCAKIALLPIWKNGQELGMNGLDHLLEDSNVNVVSAVPCPIGSVVKAGDMDVDAA